MLKFIQKNTHMVQVVNTGGCLRVFTCYQRNKMKRMQIKLYLRTPTKPIRWKCKIQFGNAILGNNTVLSTLNQKAQFFLTDNLDCTLTLLD